MVNCLLSFYFNSFSIFGKISSSFEASFIPPWAKFGRPPPFAPVALEISPTIFPAFTPFFTKLSETFTATVLSEASTIILSPSFCDKNSAWKYSVETPTVNAYSFPKGQDPRIDNNGKSGSIDLCIYQKTDGEWKRLHLVEFKAHNVHINLIKKDLLKLNAPFTGDEVNKQNYFVHLIFQANDGTLHNLKEKYEKCQAFIKRQKLPTDKQVTVFILFVHGIKSHTEATPCYLRFQLRDKFNNNEINYL